MRLRMIAFLTAALVMAFAAAPPAHALPQPNASSKTNAPAKLTPQQRQQVKKLRLQIRQAERDAQAARQKLAHLRKSHASAGEATVWQQRLQNDMQIKDEAYQAISNIFKDAESTSEALTGNVKK
jgi:uncharacterized protein HemY